MQDSDIAASVNTWTGYPVKCDTDDPTWARMIKLLDVVENAADPVMPSSAFWPMKHIVMVDGSFFARGGHAFRFWFPTEDGARAFHAEFEGALEIPPVLPKRTG